jgi:threonine/homoserine/homoserine lactone efflux protein
LPRSEKAVLTFFIKGAIAGAVTGVPIGPVNIAVIDTAYRHHLKRAIAVALGGATADLFYAMLGVLWFGPLVVTRPHIPPILYAISFFPLVIYGISILRSKPADPSLVSGTDTGQKGYFWSGFGLGMALILLNPSTLLAWVVILGTWMSEENQSSGIAAALGVGAGSFLWFAFVAWLAHKGKNFLQKRAGLINRIVGFLLIGLGCVSLGKAILYWTRL